MKVLGKENMLAHFKRGGGKILERFVWFNQGKANTENGHTPLPTCHSGSFTGDFLVCPGPIWGLAAAGLTQSYPL